MENLNYIIDTNLTKEDVQTSITRKILLFCNFFNGYDRSDVI